MYGILPRLLVSKHQPSQNMTLNYRWIPERNFHLLKFMSRFNFALQLRVELKLELIAKINRSLLIQPHLFNQREIE